MISRNKNILITGATSGIGEALALHYAQTYAKSLFICGRDAERLSAITQKCQKLGTIVYSKIIDVTDRSAMQRWIEECDKIAPLNLVIANAGVGTIKETVDSIYNTFDTNVNGVLNTVLPTIKAYRNRIKTGNQCNPDSSLDMFIDKMKKSRRAFYVPLWHRLHLGKAGCELFDNESRAIAIVSSLAGYHGLPTCPAYSASKACVKAWGEALRLKLKPEQIQVSVICPGFVRSRITDQNSCPMPGFMEADQAAKIIVAGLEKNKGLIAFPWYLRLSSWFISILPHRLGSFIYARLPNKA